MAWEIIQAITIKWYDRHKSKHEQSVVLIPCVCKQRKTIKTQRSCTWEHRVWLQDMRCSQGRLQCSRLQQHVGTSLHVQCNSTKSWLKAATMQLCIHQTNQQQLSSLDLGPTALTHPGSSLLIWKGLSSTLQETTKLYSNSGFCDSAFEIARKS